MLKTENINDIRLTCDLVHFGNADNKRIFRHFSCFSPPPSSILYYLHIENKDTLLTQHL